MSGFARETQRKIDAEWERRSELIRQQDKEYQEALAKDRENMENNNDNFDPEAKSDPKHIKQLILKAKFNHIQNGFIIPLTHCLQPHFVNQHGSIQEDLTEMDSDDEDEYSDVQYTLAPDLKLEHTILRPHGIKHLIEINKRPEEKEEEEDAESSEDSDDDWENYSRYSSDNEKESSSKPTPNPFGDSSTDEDEDYHEENERWFKQKEQNKLDELARLKEEGIIPVQLKIPEDLAAVIHKDSITVYAACESNCRALKIISPYPVSGISRVGGNTWTDRVGGNTWTELAENNTEDNLKHFFSEIESLNRHFTKKPSTINSFSFLFDFSSYRLAKPCWKRLLEIFENFNNTCVRTIQSAIRGWAVEPFLIQDFEDKSENNVEILKKTYLELMKTFFTSMYNAMNEEVETFKKSLNEDDLEVFESHENGDRYKLEKLFEDKDRFVFQIPKMKKYIEKGYYNFINSTAYKRTVWRGIRNNFWRRTKLRDTNIELKKIYFDTKKNFEDWIKNMLIPEVDRTLVVVNDLYQIFQKKGYFVNMFSKAYCEKINLANWSGIRIDGTRIELEYLPGYEEMTREISLQCMKKNTRDIFVKWKNYESLLTEQLFDEDEVHKQNRKWDMLGIGTDGSSIFKYRDTIMDISDRAKRYLVQENNFAYKTIQIQSHMSSHNEATVNSKDWADRWILIKFNAYWTDMYHHYIEELDELQKVYQHFFNFLPSFRKKWNDIKTSMLLFYDRLYNRPLLNMMYIDNHRVTDPFEEYAHIHEYPMEGWEEYITMAKLHNQPDIFDEKGWNYVRGTEYNKMQMFFKISAGFGQEKGFEDFRFTNDPDLPLNFCDMIYACNLLTIELAKNPLKIDKLDSKKTAEQLPFGDMFVPDKNKELYRLHQAREERKKSNKTGLKSMKDLKFSKTILRF